MSLIQEEHYSTIPGVRIYLHSYYSNVEQDSITVFRFKCYNNFFEKYSSKWNKTTARLLDFSAGAVIMNYISAAPHVAEIFHSAYTEAEREHIELWKSNAEGAHDWNPFIKYVVDEIEGLKGDAALEERVALLRSKVKVISCNVYDDHPIGTTEKQNVFSVICTSLSLENSCKTYEDFKAGIKKLVKLLKIGGYLAMIFDEDETFYLIGQDKRSSIPLSLKQVIAAVEEAGCVVLMSERDPQPIHLMENPTKYDAKACVFLAAYKVKD